MRKHTLILGTSIGFLLAAALTLQTGHGADKTNSLADTNTIGSNVEQMQALRKEVDDAEAAYMKAFHDESVSKDQTEKLWDVYKHINATNLPKIFELARQGPASETAFEMFGWIVTNRQIQMRSLYTNGLESIEFLRDYHATNPNIARICRTLGTRWEPTCQPAIDFLQIAAKKNPDREVRGQATLALARLKKDNADNLVFWESAPQGDTQFEKARTAYLEKAKNENSKTVSREAEKLFNLVLGKYADCPTLQPTNTWQVKATLSEVAKAELYELNHLSIGKVAPEIEGEDIDGKKLKLSDYRGKIVVLSFWASWCGPCMAMVPSEVRLAKRMNGKPFSLVGVNGDCIRDDAKHAVEKKKITWPSFWSKEGPDGAIPTKWNVGGWPTVFVLDPKGVIRFKLEGYGGTNTENILNQKIDQILSPLSDKTRT
jgi:thiol-disulfide isomerase/thioredoxin